MCRLSWQISQIWYLSKLYKCLPFSSVCITFIVSVMILCLVCGLSKRNYCSLFLTTWMCYLYLMLIFFLFILCILMGSPSTSFNKYRFYYLSVNGGSLCYVLRLACERNSFCLCVVKESCDFLTSLPLHVNVTHFVLWRWE